MSTSSSSSSSSSRPLILSLELSLERLSALAVDADSLAVVRTERVEFGKEQLEFNTHGGVHHSEAQTIPPEMWIKAIDVLFEKLQSMSFPFSTVRALTTAAPLPLPLLFSPSARKLLSSLSPLLPLHPQLFPAQPSPSLLANPYAPSPLASSGLPRTHALERALPPETWTTLTGARPSSASAPAHLAQVHEALRHRAAHVRGPGAFLVSALAGCVRDMGEGEAAGMGLWNVWPRKDEWVEEACETVMGGSEEGGLRLQEMLGNVEKFGDEKTQFVGPYLVERYSFSPTCLLPPALPQPLALLLALRPPLSSQDALLSLGTSDFLLAPLPLSQDDPAQAHVPPPQAMARVLPDPRKAGAERVVMIENINAGPARTSIRQHSGAMSWSAFDVLIAAVPPGGSVGLDDKLFLFVFPQPEQLRSNSSAAAYGVYRFETGVRVIEFGDLRANPRALLESQFLSLRRRLSLCLPSANSTRPPPTLHRIYATGAPTRSSQIPQLAADVLGADVLVAREGGRTPEGAWGAALAAWRDESGAQWNWEEFDKKVQEKLDVFQAEVQRTQTQADTSRAGEEALAGGVRFAPSHIRRNTGPLSPLPEVLELPAVDSQPEPSSSTPSATANVAHALSEIFSRTHASPSPPASPAPRQEEGGGAARRGFERVGLADRDAWEFYAALGVEFERLEGMCGGY